MTAPVPRHDPPGRAPASPRTNKQSARPAQLAVLALAALLLAATATLRGAEYDEQYTLFLSGGTARPAWPATPFPAGRVAALQAGTATPAAIAHDLRATDVHPPLYFWAVASWRRLFGGGLLTARLFSVACGVAALAAVAAIARRLCVPVVPAMLLTLGCYGFAYTGAIARGFALAQALTLGGAALLRADGRRGRALIGGLLLGAAILTNYLAAFTALALAAAIPLAGPHRRTQAARFRRSLHAVAPALAGCLAVLPAVLWFFLPQRGSRPGQFPPFHLLPALARLARDAAAALFGGLPLYAPPALRPLVVAGGAALILAAVGLVAARWSRIPVAARRIALAAALAPPLGLLLLGAAFDNTPIELRYLAFATPFAALLLAAALATLPPRAGRAALGLLLAVQAAGLLGLMTRPETMQPAAATAAAVTRLAASIGEPPLVLLPGGNDGVGIVGALADALPPAQRLLVVGPDATPGDISARIGDARHVVLALLAQDAASRATLPLLRAAFAVPCWRRAGADFQAVAFTRICGDATR
jgi:hypothetical protein